MPRKKLKQQFRRGNEQRYLRTAVYSPGQHGGLQIPFLSIFLFACALGLGITLFLYQRAIVDFFQQQSLPQFGKIGIIEAIIAIPGQIIQTVRSIQFPEVTIDITPLQIWIGSASAVLSATLSTIASFLFTSFLNVVQFLDSLIRIGLVYVLKAIESVVTIFFALYDTVIMVFDFWVATFFVPAIWMAKLFIHHSVPIYKAGQATLLVTYALAALIVTFVSSLVMQTFSGILAVMAFVIRTVLGFLSAIDNIITGTLHVISVQTDTVASVFRPYINTTKKTLGLSLHEFKRCIDIFVHDFQGIVATYEHNAKH